MTDMNGTRVIALLDRVAATRSKNEKQGILREQIEDPFLLAVLTWAYDPYITFGVTASVPAALRTGTSEFDLNSVTIWGQSNGRSKSHFEPTN